MDFVEINIVTSVDSNGQEVLELTLIFPRILIGRKIFRKKNFCHQLRGSNKSEWNSFSISVDSSVDSNQKKVGYLNLIFSPNLIGRKIFFLTGFVYITKLNKIFSTSIFTPLSIPISKRSMNWISYFLEFWLVEKFITEKIDFSTNTMIKQKSIGFLPGSVSTRLSIPMSKRSTNWISYFLEFWLVEKFLRKRIFFSPISRIQQRSKEFYQHHCSPVRRFQWWKSGIF